MAIRPLPLYKTEKELYDALTRRQDQAYHYLYTDVFPSFQHWVLTNSGSAMDAEDSFQKGLMNFLLNIETGKYQLQAGTRITTVAFEYCKRVWQTELKSARFRRSATLTDSVDAIDTSDVIKDLERMDVVNAVQQSLRQLKEDCRKLLEWFYVDELSLRDIAERLGLKEESVKSKRYQCAEKMKAFYQQTAKQQGL